MTILFIVNDPPYGAERVYNALRLAASRPARGHWYAQFACFSACAG
jgi:sulfur relay (sulfurtransferase) complex TusBCD TusD component (DsrE family)